MSCRIEGKKVLVDFGLSLISARLHCPRVLQVRRLLVPIHELEVHWCAKRPEGACAATPPDWIQKRNSNTFWWTLWKDFIVIDWNELEVASASIVLEALSVVPKEGWAQIVAFAGFLELVVNKKTSEPGKFHVQLFNFISFVEYCRMIFHSFWVT